MKKIATSLGLPLLTLCLVLWSGLTIGQTLINLQPDQSLLVPGSIILVPVNVTSTFESAELYFTYDKDVLTPATPFTTGIDPNFTITASGPDYNLTTSTIQVSSVDFSNHTLTGTSLVSLRFVFDGGSTSIHLRKSPDPSPICKFFDEFGIQVTPYTFTDATMSGSSGATVYSSTGVNLLWKNASSWKMWDGTPGFVPTGNVNAVITSDSVTIDANARAKYLTINPTGKLTLNSGKTLTATGNFTIESGGSFIDKNTSNTLAATVQRTMNGNWVQGHTSYISHLVSSPVANQLNSMFNGSLMNKWNEVTQYWDPLSFPYITMGIGTGYAVAPLNPGITATFNGVLNTGSVIVSGLTKTGATTWSGYNLVGNPYPCAIKWNSNITLSNVDPSAWVWNGAGAYIANIQGSGGVIGAEQGFFVHATATGSVTFTNAVRTHLASSFYKSTISDLLTLKVEGNNFWDQTQVLVNSLATEGYEAEYDALKLMGSADAPQIYTMLPSENLSINSLPSLSSSMIIKLGFIPGAAGNFTITASDLESFPASTDFFLEDLVANKNQNLKISPVYNFEATPGQNEHRFNLHFAPVGVSENRQSSINIYSAESIVYVNVPIDMKGNIVVYDMLGREISSTAIQSNSLNKINLGVPTGFYLVKVNGDSNTTTGKVFIR